MTWFPELLHPVYSMIVKLIAKTHTCTQITNEMKKDVKWILTVRSVRCLNTCHGEPLGLWGPSAATAAAVIAHGEGVEVTNVYANSSRKKHPQRYV